MLESLEFKNYRCFLSHKLPLKKETIIVGKNNAGKSTVIEGFRLVGLITERYQHLPFQDVPDWLDIPKYNKGVRVDLSGLNLIWENLFHRYTNPPAQVIGTFSDGSTIEIYLGPKPNMHAVIKASEGNLITSKNQIKNFKFSKVSVLPQIMPLSRNEVIMRPDYIRSNITSYLSSSHFRNQLNLFYKEYFRSFKKMVEKSWPGLKVISLQGKGDYHGGQLDLLIRDGDFVAEVALMGHGLQMWLQAMWLLTRTSTDSIVVLDEPDVYMHPDLQRRLLRFIRNRYYQEIIATHSTEIVAEADPSNILIIDPMALT
jgi:predicted ATP-dependent endonuclease of OLD family